MRRLDCAYLPVGVFLSGTTRGERVVVPSLIWAAGQRRPSRCTKGGVGPWTTTMVKCWLDGTCIAISARRETYVFKDLLTTLHSLTVQYGETVLLQIGPNRTNVLTADPKFSQFLLTHTNIMKKSSEYAFLSNWLGTGLLTSDGDSKWKQHRHALAPAFHNTILQRSMDIFQRNADILAEKLSLKLHDRSINLHPLITLCSLDMICEAAMGTSIKAQTQEDSDYVRSVKEMCRIIVMRSFSFWKNNNFLYQLSIDYQKEKKAVGILQKYTDEVIRNYLSAQTIELSNNFTNSNKKPFLQLLLSEMETNSLSIDEIRQEVNTFMFAGHDTTASAMSFILFCLSENPQIQSKVFEEQKDIFELSGWGRAVTMDDIREMRYLDLVIKESLRLYPSVPFYAREVTKDTLYEGKLLPKGVNIIIFVYAMHRSPKYYNDPEKFIPERFELFEEKSTYLPFSAGPRNCIGQKFAYIEMKTVLSNLIRKFEFLSTDPPHKLCLSSETVLISTNGICLRISKRNNPE